MKTLWLALLVGLTANAGTTTVKDAKTLEGSYAMENVLVDSGIEGDVRANWTASGGSLSSTTTAANVGRGSKSGSFDASSASQILASKAVAIPAGLYGKNSEASILLKCNSGTCTHLLQAYDGSNILVSSTITSSTTYTRSRVNFIMPSSGNIQLRVVSVASDEPLIYFDDAYLGEARNIAQVSQAQFIGSAYIPATASCLISRTGTTYASYTGVAACPGPTVEYNPGPGTIQTTDTDLPKFTVNNLPPGEYEATLNFMGYGSGGGASGGVAFTLSDGTTTSGVVNPIGTTGVAMAQVLIGHFSYSTAGNRTFELQGKASANTQTWDNTGAFQTTFRLVRLPSTPEQAIRPDQMPASWAGVHSTDCAFARTNAAFGDPAADTTCTFTERYNRNFGTVTSYLSGSDKLPGVVFTPPRVGRYLVTAVVGLTGATSTSFYSARLSDGTNTIATGEFRAAQASDARPITLTGVFDATSSTATSTLRIQIAGSSGAATIQGPSIGTAIDWSIVELDAPMPAPFLVGSSVFNAAGATNMLYANLNCDAGSAITSQSGTTSIGIATIGNISSGVCAGTFAGMWSGTPMCVASAKGATLDQAVRIDATSSTAYSLYCIVASTGAAATTCDASVICAGPK